MQSIGFFLLAFVTVQMFIKTPVIHVESKGLDCIFSLVRMETYILKR